MLSPALRRPFWRLFPKIDIPIADCVHYAGFRYGRGEYNPYETYLIDGHGPHAKAQFIEFLKYYRPRTMAEALDVPLLEPVPLWCFPWQWYLPSQWTMERGWKHDPVEVPDILTHFSETGILEWRIREEFSWLDGAMSTISRGGYQPRRFGYVQVITLRGASDAHLILDGNHRIAALSALGEKIVRAVRIGTVRDVDVKRWPGVRSGKISTDGAMAIFAAYFRGRARHRTTDTPAAVI